MKRIILLLICLTFLLNASIFVRATEPKIVDSAELLTENEKENLEILALQISDQYNMDIVIVTVLSLNGKSSESYADDYFDNNGYGFGNDYSGILLLLSVEHRDWAISTCGEGILALTDYAIQSVFSEISEDLSNDRYYQAFCAYLEALIPFLDAYRRGEPIDGSISSYDGPGIYISGAKDDMLYHTSQRDFFWYLQKVGIGFIVGLVVALIVLLILRGRMNTANPQHGAASYMLQGSYRLTLQRDIYLYSQTKKVRRSENSSSGGGSSVHRSSGGRSHGGGHGKF